MTVYTITGNKNYRVLVIIGMLNVTIDYTVISMFSMHELRVAMSLSHYLPTMGKKHISLNVVE